MFDFSLLMALYSKTDGWNVSLIFGWFLFFILTHKGLGHAIEALGTLVKKLLNRLPILSETTVDDELVDKFLDDLYSEVRGSMQEAEEIKERALIDLKAALEAQDMEAVRRISDEKKKALESLTHEIVDSALIKDKDAAIKILEKRYGSRVNLIRWLWKEIRCMVDELKEPDHPSVGRVLTNHLLATIERLGNSLAPGGEED